MSERREGYINHENLWSNDAYDLHGDSSRIKVREVLSGDDERESRIQELLDAIDKYPCCGAIQEAREALR